MLSKHHRLPSSDVKIVMRTGRRVHNAGVTLFYKRLDPRLRGDDNSARFAVIVPGGVDKRAVGRNRIRRVTREALRLVLPKIALGWDGVFFIRKRLPDAFGVVDGNVRELLRRAGVLNESKLHKATPCKNQGSGL